MNILHLNTYDTGGASVAAQRLHEGLLNAGVNSKMLFLEKSKANIPQSFYYVKKYPKIHERILKKYKISLSQTERLRNKLAALTGDFEILSLPVTDFDVTKNELYAWADIIHLHWVGNFLDWGSFFLKNEKPVVWTFHDQNPVLGLFHYRNDQERNKKSYGLIDYEMKLLKAHAIENRSCELKIITPSKWLAKEVTSSKIFKNVNTDIIPYGVPEKIFHPMEKKCLRNIFNIPEEKRIVLFVADNVGNYRKGFRLLIDGLLTLGQENIKLIAVGSKLDEDIKLEIDLTGPVLQKEYLAQLYSIADVFVIASREDNLPNTVLEAMASGTPVIGFNVGGLPDMIIDNETGLIVNSVDPLKLGERIRNCLSNDTLRNKMGLQARKFIVQNFSMQLQATRYISLYNQTLA